MKYENDLNFRFYVESNKSLSAYYNAKAAELTCQRMAQTRHGWPPPLKT